MNRECEVSPACIRVEPGMDVLLDDVQIRLPVWLFHKLPNYEDGFPVCGIADGDEIFQYATQLLPILHDTLLLLGPENVLIQPYVSFQHGYSSFVCPQKPKRLLKANKCPHSRHFCRLSIKTLMNGTQKDEEETPSTQISLSSLN